MLVVDWSIFSGKIQLADWAIYFEVDRRRERWWWWLVAVVFGLERWEGKGKRDQYCAIRGDIWFLLFTGRP